MPGAAPRFHLRPRCPHGERHTRPAEGSGRPRLAGSQPRCQAGARGPPQRRASERVEPGLPPLSLRERSLRLARPVPAAAPLSPRLPSVKFPGSPQREAGRQEQPQGELHGRRGLRWPPRRPRAGGGGGGAPGRAGVRLPPRPAALPRLRVGRELGALPFPLPVPARLAGGGGAARGATAPPDPGRGARGPPRAARSARGTWRAWDTWGGRAARSPLLRTARRKPRSGGTGEGGLPCQELLYLELPEGRWLRPPLCKAPVESQEHFDLAFYQPNLPNNKAF